MEVNIIYKLFTINESDSMDFCYVIIWTYLMYKLIKREQWIWSIIHLLKMNMKYHWMLMNDN